MDRQAAAPADPTRSPAARSVPSAPRASADRAPPPRSRRAAPPGLRRRPDPHRRRVPAPPACAGASAPAPPVPPWLPKGRSGPSSPLGSAPMQHFDLATLEAGLDEVRKAPTDDGRIELIWRRPETEQREVLDEGVLDVERGLVGDNWQTRGSSSTSDGSANPLMQLTLMNVRSASLIAGTPERRQLAGDQFFVDFDLSVGNIPPGSRLKLGEAVVEISEIPHRGCGKFSARFGVDALKFVNSEVGRALNLRGVNARIVRGGVVRRGDVISKVS